MPVWAAHLVHGVMWSDYYELVTKPPAAGQPPVAHGYGFYILVEALGGDEEADSERFCSAIGSNEEGIVADGAIAQSQGERDAMWAIRDDVGQVAQFGRSLRLTSAYRSIT